MYGREHIVLQRDVNAIRIPDGDAIVLPQGHIIGLFQSLGGNFTVTTESGHMVRISGADADAIGKEPPSMPPLLDQSDTEAVEKNIWEVLKTVFDPEIPVNIVDLGLVYHCGVKPAETGQPGHTVHIIMTLTAPGCGMGPILQNDVEQVVRKLPSVTQVQVDVVFDPPWSRDHMSEMARLQLNMV